MAQNDVKYRKDSRFFVHAIAQSWKSAEKIYQ